MSASVDAWLAIVFAAEQSARRAWREALAHYASAAALAAAPPSALLRFGVPEEAAARLRALDDARIGRWRAWLGGARRALIGLDDPRYPDLLARTDDPPLALWIEGAVELLTAPQLAIVGSRNPTHAGRDTAEQFARHLSQRGITITSGLASGIDGASHRGALQGPGSTVAVLGTGPDRVFPREHRALAAEVVARGLAVTEYPPGVPVQKHHFPHRNRIIAGLSTGTLVVEAARKSGALITAHKAGDYGREIFAIPGSIHNPLARGCHLLIREGAKLVEEAGDILVELAPLLSLAPEAIATPANEPDDARAADPAYASVIAALGYDPVPFATVLERCHLTAAELSSMLLVLELEGFVEALPGSRYARRAKGKQ